MRLSALALAALIASPGAKAGDAIGELASRFDTHPLIWIGEIHRSRETHGFLQQLLHDPRFICRADAVVVEFGNARLQPVADAYAHGADVPEDAVRDLLRATAVPLAWNSPVYRAVYDAVRAINVEHRCDHPVRLVFGDPPLDWSRIATAADYAPFDDRDGHFADVIEREVLAKGGKALVISGQFHALKRSHGESTPGDEEKVAAQLIERAHPEAVFTVVAVSSPAAATALGLGPPPDFRPVRGLPLGDVDFAMTLPGWPQGQAVGATGRIRLAEGVDGVLWLGGNHSEFPSPAIYLDPDYQAELRRRMRILEAYSGQDFESVLDDLVRQATEGGDGAQTNVPKD
jgi:hypothetical protein